MYQQTQWYAFEEIVLSQRNRYNTTVRLNYYFSELQKIEYDYIDNLNRLEIFISKLKELGTMGNALACLKSNLKIKISHHQFFAESLKQSICPSDKLRDMMIQQSKIDSVFKEEESKFITTINTVEKAKERHHDILRKLEKSIDDSIHDNKSKTFNEAKILNKNKALLKSEEMEKINYCKEIIKANIERNAFEKKINEMLSSCEEYHSQQNDQLEKALNLYITHEKKLYEGLRQDSCILSDNISLIDKSKDIKTFCDSTHRHGYAPKAFDYAVYKFDNELKDKDKLVKDNYKMEIKQFFCQRFRYFPPEGLHDDNIKIKYRQVEQLVLKIIKENQNLSDKEYNILSELFLEREFRAYFISWINSSRTEQTQLTEIQFDELCCFMRIILQESIQTELPDYELISLIIILSQTLYKPYNDPQEPRYLLQYNISQHPIWQRRDIWIGLINYIIDHEITANGKKLNSSEKKEDILNREAKTVLIKLSTYKFIMTEFKYNTKEMISVLNEIAQKYNMQKEIIDSLLSIEYQELQNEIIEDANHNQIGMGNIPELMNQVNEEDNNNEIIQGSNVITEQGVNK